MPNIVNFIGPVHMGSSHKGLRERALASGFDLNGLENKEFVIFVASHGKRYKAYGSKNAYIDHDLRPMTLAEYLADTGGNLDVGLEYPITFRLTKRQKAELNRFFLEIENNKKSKRG